MKVRWKFLRYSLNPKIGIWKASQPDKMTADNTRGILQGVMK